MKILYCYRYGILGGVCTQLWNRLRFISENTDWDTHILLGMDLGFGSLFRGMAEVHVGKDTSELYDWACEENFDTIVVIDTAEYFEAFARENAPYRLIAEVHTSIRKNLGYLENRQWNPDKFLVPSAYMKDMLTESFDIPPSAIEVAYNSVDDETFFPDPVENPPEKPVLAWVGKIDDHKNWRGFFQVAELVRNMGHDIEVWVVGGQKCPDERAERLFAEAETRGFISDLRWLDRVENAAMRRLYTAVAQSGGCKVVTTKNESFGMSLLEAMLCGCPVVSSDVGSLGELSRDDSFIRFYPYEAYSMAAEHIAALITEAASKKARASLAETREHFVERFSPRATTSTYCAIVEGLSKQEQAYTVS